MSNMMDLANQLFKYEHLKATGVDASEVTKLIMTYIEDDTMLPLYEHLCVKFGWGLDASMAASMREKIDAELKEIEEKLEYSKANAGDTDVLDALFVKARFYSRIGNWRDADETFKEILSREKTTTGKKIDAIMEQAKIALFNMETKKLKDCITEAKRLNDLGGDWDRRNRLKVYEGHYLMATRDVHGAAKLFLECVATFTCVELCSYKQFMFYTLVTSIVSLNRTELRKMVINDPHVITVMRELPDMQLLINSIYNCEYAGFFKAILGVHPLLMGDRFLAPLAVYLVREYRVLAYAQFLEAYKSVMLSSMATSFGISVDLLDAELSRFIAAGRLNAKIDKMGDIIETRRPDKKNGQYHDVIKKGDHLLNQIQKLVRAIDV